MHHLIKILVLASIVSGCRPRQASDLKVGGKDGNSGDVVVCNWDSPAQRKIWFLDHYEVINDPHAPSALVPLSPQEIVRTYPQNYKNIAQALINRLKNVDPYRLELYSSFIANFDDESYVGLDLNMPDLPDRGPSFVTIPRECRVELAAYQQTPQKVKNKKLSDQVRKLIEKRYIIEKKYWDALDDFNKGILIAHEVFYREARAYGFRQSKLIRLFSSFLLRNAYPNQNQRQEFAETLIHDYGLPAIIPAKEIQAAYETVSITSYPNGNIASGIIAAIPDLYALENEVMVTPKQLTWFANIPVADKVYQVLAGMKVTYFESKAVSGIEDTRTFEDYLADISPNAALFGGKSLLGIGSATNGFTVGGCEFKFYSGFNSRIKKIQFSNSGSIRSMTLDSENVTNIVVCEADKSVTRNVDKVNNTLTITRNE